MLRLKVTAFVELFRESLAREQQAAELSEVVGDELRDVSGRLVLAAIKRDEQAEAQRALRDEAETALSTRDDFVSTTARQLRTPALGIKTSAQLALQALVGATSDPELMVQGYLEVILGSADRLLLLTSSLNDGSERGP